MATDTIIRYDGEFMRRFEALGAMIDNGDRPALHRFLIDAFGFLFRANQAYWKLAAQGGAPDFEAADADTRRELMRPLSHRQYRMIEQAFMAAEDRDVIGAIWDFLHDEGRINDKKVMSPAEVGGFSLILEQVYICLSRA